MLSYASLFVGKYFKKYYKVLKDANYSVIRGMRISNANVNIRSVLLRWEVYDSI
jgi:hypothetical protein